MAQSPFAPAPRPEPVRHSALWKASVFALAAASAADLQSSLGRRELNPVLSNADGRFAARGIAVKAFISGGAIGIQWLLLRHRSGAEKYAAIANFATASGFGVAAAHNHLNRR